MEEPKEIFEALAQLLEPLGSKRKDLILGWVRREIATHAIVQYVYEEGPPITRGRERNEQGIEVDVELGGPQLWRIGEPSPLVGDETIFAMFHMESGAVAAYSFKHVEVDGQAGVFFYRSLICKPVHVHGPVHHDALCSELGGFLEEEEELESVLEAVAETHTNGASA